MLADEDVSRFEAFSGPLWNQVNVRTRLKGQQSFLEIDSVANGSTINTLLGLPTGGAEDFGETLSFVKNNGETLTVVYEFKMENPLDFNAGAL